MHGEASQHFLIRTSRIDVDRAPGAVIEDQKRANGTALSGLLDRQGNGFQRTRHETEKAVEAGKAGESLG
ncbi:hypothetical protein D3C81_1651860 [compost metagenome]